ncbi:MAG: DsbA family protein [Pseudomonadota bacterium]
MATQFKDQGGAATMDPSPLMRWLTSQFMRRMAGEKQREKKRAAHEKSRKAAGKAHVVEYFHYVEDGYSHLAAQVLPALAERYDIDLVCHLVRGPQGKNSAEPELLLQLSRYDAFHVAPEYGLAFPEHPQAPPSELVNLAESILAAQDGAGFARLAGQVGEALWAGDQVALQALEGSHGSATDAQRDAQLQASDARRHELKHYSGAMFYYGGEWYWGVDRLYHLEERLAGLGADCKPGEPMLVPRPAIAPGTLKDDGSLTLEVYPSLRSPYTAICFDKAVQLARDTGVNLVVRPVLPMVMRGVPATREKGTYIFFDTQREAQTLGVPFGNVYDPIGDPVRRCYSIYPWACEQGKGIELLSSFLRAAFAEGVNTNNDRGLKQVVEAAGLNWAEAMAHLGDSAWEEILEENRLCMYEAGIWGVPSFRLLDSQGQQLLALWGQDRLWLFAREIQRQLQAREGG